MTATDHDDVRYMYLDLLKQCLTRYGFEQAYRPLSGTRRLARVGSSMSRIALEPRGLALVKRVAFDPEARAEGRDRPIAAETMVGLARLDNLEHCVALIVEDGVPGDLIEAGAWRGGASIFMRALLKAYEDSVRTVWVADSFRGLPHPDPATYAADAGDSHWTEDELAVSMADVQANFARYGLLDEQVRFLPGWFRDTLPGAPMERLALMRLDGDMYESTIVALESLYPKLSVGGFVIIDDYGAVEGCKRAVDDFRAARSIDDDLVRIDWTGMFWRRSA